MKHLTTVAAGAGLALITLLQPLSAQSARLDAGFRSPGADLRITFGSGDFARLRQAPWGRERVKSLREHERERLKSLREHERERLKDLREAEREYMKDVREAEREYRKEARESARERLKHQRERERELLQRQRELRRDFR